MIEDHRERIILLLKDAGEHIETTDELSITRLGEGLGYTSLLWSVRVGGKRYAVKITDLAPRLEEAKAIYGDDQEKIESHLALFTQQHDRELQAYRYIESIRHPDSKNLSKVARFFGGCECTKGAVGIIIMADLSETSVAPEPCEEGLAIETILSTIDGIIGYQAAYLSTDREAHLVTKDVLFVLGSAGVIGCIDKVDEGGYLTPEWKNALLTWSTPGALREMQYGVEEGEPPLVLGHTDMWLNNILFERNRQSGELQLLAFVDWQCATVGLAMMDIASVVGMNMSPTERRSNEDTILRHYVDSMKEKRKEFVREFEADFDKVRRLYRRCLRFAALQLCLTVGGMLTAPEGESEEAIEKRRRHGEQLNHCAERLKGILEDIVVV